MKDSEVDQAIIEIDQILSAADHLNSDRDNIPQMMVDVALVNAVVLLVKVIQTKPEGGLNDF